MDRSQAPALNSIVVNPMPTDRQVMLSCGTLVNIQPRTDYELVKIGLLIPGGKLEFGRFNAVAGLSMLKEGTRFHSGESIAETFDFNGAEFTSGASEHYGIVSVYGLRRNIDKIIPLLFEMLSEPSYPAPAMDALQRSMATSLQVQMTTPIFHATVNAQRQMVGPYHPLGQPPSIEEILAINAQGLSGIRSQWLNARLLSVYASGAVDDSLLKMIEQGMETLPYASDMSLISYQKVVSSEPCLDTVQVDNSLQNSIMAWLPSVDIKHRDYFALRVAVQALGGYFGSRLMQNIREDKGFTYGISASMNWRKELSVIQISCDCDDRYTQGVLSELKHELERMVSDPLSDDELNRVRLNMSSWLASMSDTPESIQGRRMTLAGSGMPLDYYDQLMEQLPHITSDDIMRVSEIYLRPDDLRVTIAGNVHKMI